MAQSKVTSTMEKYFIENAFKISENKLAREYNLSTSVVKRVFKKNNIVVSKELQNKFRIEGLKGKTTFTNEQSNFIKENYLEIPIKAMAKILGKSDCGVRCRLRQLKLEIPKEIAIQRKAKGMFRKGQIPVNKGKKQIEYMSPEGIEKSKKTRFKKGQLAHNAFNDFEHTNRIDKRTGRVYTLIKLPEKSKLIYKHIWLWELHNNKKIKPNENIVFIDGNTQNISIENLECVSDKELMNRNTLHKYPKEIKELINIKAQITRQINKHLKP